MLLCILLAASPLGQLPKGDKAKIALGHDLFFDKRMSADGSRSCYSCHQNEDGTGGHDPIAIGAKEKKLTRHAPIMWNVGFLKRFYWDGRSDSLEAQGKAAWAGGNMGVGADNLAAKAKELEPIYGERFKKAFGDAGMTPETMMQAVAEYERTLVCDNTAFDKNKLNAKQKEGLALFNGKAGCATCHAAPFFSTAFDAPEGMYFNVGIETEDVGRMSVMKNEADKGAFKVPSLRNVSKSAPYFHDGSVATLTDAVRFMASGGGPAKNKSTSLVDRKLNDKEIEAIVQFLGSLDCAGKLE